MGKICTSGRAAIADGEIFHLGIANGDTVHLGAHRDCRREPGTPRDAPRLPKGDRVHVGADLRKPFGAGQLTAAEIFPCETCYGTAGSAQVRTAALR